MDTKKVILLGAGVDTYRVSSDMDEAVKCTEKFDQYGSGDCKNDHGDRSNCKLRDQPFYQRAQSGKMKKW